MSTTTSLEFRIKFDSFDSLMRQCEFLEKARADEESFLSAMVDSFGMMSDEKNLELNLNACVHGTTDSRDIVNFVWGLISDRDSVDSITAIYDNLENGDYGMIISHSPFEYKEKCLDRRDVIEVVNQNSYNLIDVYPVLEQMLGGA